MRVQDVMTEGVKTIAPTATARERLDPDATAQHPPSRRDLRCLVVVESGHVTGLVTVSDLLERVGRGLHREAAISKRWTLKHRAPHRKSKGLWVRVDANPTHPLLCTGVFDVTVCGTLR